MIDQQVVQQFGRQIHDLWIAPELKRRWGSTSIPLDFKIRRCLIRLPVRQAPIVEFNHEVRWLAEVKFAEGHSIVTGDDVYLHQIESVKAAQPPEVDGNRSAQSGVDLIMHGRAFVPRAIRNAQVISR